MNTSQAKSTLTNWKMAVVCIALLGLTACGSGSTEISEPADAPTVKPAATFQSIKVTVPPAETPTPEPTAEGTPTTKGVTRPFPELLKTTEGVTIGPLLTTWQSYLSDGVMVFENNAWDLCYNERGTGQGEMFVGDIIWTLGPPRVKMLGNELFLIVWHPETKDGVALVVGYQNETPILKRITNYDQYGSEPFEYIGNPIPFEMYELTTCVNR